MPAGQASSADPSNNAAMMTAALDVAQNHAGITWWGTMAGDMPIGAQVKGFPYLAVLEPELAGSVDDGRFVPGQLRREPGVVEPVWQIEVWGFWPFHPYDPLTYSTTRAARDSLVQAFTIYWALESSADYVNIQSADLTDTQLRGGHRFRAVQLVLQAGESLLVNYH